jgi:hypothetical protein
VKIGVWKMLLTWGLIHTDSNGEVVREKIPSEKGNYMHFFDALYHAITEGKPVPVSADDGLRNIKIISCCL